MEATSQHIECKNPKGFLSRGYGFHKLHYYEWGDDSCDKTVICVHGLTMNARDFDYLACTLSANGYRVICPDIVGRGKSDWLSNPKWYGYPLYVADMTTLLTTLGLSSVHWIGTSMGGLIGMMLESSMPHIIDKMVINDIGPFIPKESLMRIGSYVGQNMVFDTMEEAENNLRKNFAPFGITDESHWQHMITNHITQKDDGKYHGAYDPAISNAFWNKRGKQRKMHDMNLWKMWNLIHCPMLVLRGEQSDLLIKDTALRMQKNDNVELVEFPNIGHAPSLMDNHQIDIILKWLQAA